MKKSMPDEEVAFKIVSIYFEEIARLGFKRSLDLDSIINAYFYTLEKVKGKEQMLADMLSKVLEEEKKIPTQQRDDIIPPSQ